MNDHEHAGWEVYQTRIQEAERDIIALRTRLQVAEAKLTTVPADLEHRIRLLEGRTANVMARLDGHDLGFVTMGLDEDGRRKLAAMLRESGSSEGSQGSCDDAIGPEEEVTDGPSTPTETGG